MEYEDQHCLGLFLLELKGHRGKLLSENLTITTHQQGTIMILLLVLDPLTSQLRNMASKVSAKEMKSNYD